MFNVALFMAGGTGDFRTATWIIRGTQIGAFTNNEVIFEGMAILAVQIVFPAVHVDVEIFILVGDQREGQVTPLHAITTAGPWAPEQVVSEFDIIGTARAHAGGRAHEDIVTFEIASSAKSMREKRECDSCGHHVHDADANYCKSCGEKL